MKVKDEPGLKSLPRIGVILCYCGSELREALDFARIEEYVRALPGVVFSVGEPYPCSRVGAARMAEAIKDNQLERLVVAGCTPRLHGKLLAEVCESAGMNRWLMDVANIREHCSRVHRNRMEATEKAKALIRASVKKVSLAEPYEPIRVTPLKSVLVIGGGVSGLSVAAELMSLGQEVTLIEKDDTLGGMLLRLSRPYPYARSGKEIIEEKVSRIKDKVEILKRTVLGSLKGGPGQYRVTLSSDGKSEERSFGAIVVATGAGCVGPEGLSTAVHDLGDESAPATSHVGRNGQLSASRDTEDTTPETSRKASSSKEALFSKVSVFGGRVLTQMDLEEGQVARKLKGARSVLFVNIPPAELGHSGARVYSLAALKNAVSVKEANPKLELSFVFKDVPHDLEREFCRARDAGVKFIRYAEEKTLEFTRKGLRLPAIATRRVEESPPNGGRPKKTSADASRAAERPAEKGPGEPSPAGQDYAEIKADVVVLPGVVRPPEGSGELSHLLRVPVDAHGFFIEPHIKLKPGDFVERGIFVVGSCHSPATILECTAQAMVAASRASRFVSSELVRAPFVSRIDERICRGCSRCAEACEWNAIEMVPLENDLKLARVDESLCTGCGVCSTVCICGAPSLGPVGQNQVRAMVEVLAGEG